MNYHSVLLLISFLITGCTPTQSTQPVALTPTPTITSAPTITFTQTPINLPPGKEIIFESSGGKDFTGTAYGEGKTVILLANMSIGGEKQWNPFVAVVDKHRFTTITFDYRNINDVNPDMDLVHNWFKRVGFTRVICIGASLGTRACSHIALEPEIVGMVLIAGSVHHATVAEATYPKLFIAGALDRWAFDIKNGYQTASEPKTLVLFENNRVHGTDLFHSKDSEQFLTMLINFVNGVANP